MNINLPDWKNKDQYPNNTITKPEEWAWEFLRRNPDYQSDYADLLDFEEKNDYESNANIFRAGHANASTSFLQKEYDRASQICAQRGEKFDLLFTKYSVLKWPGSDLPDPRLCYSQADPRFDRYPGGFFDDFTERFYRITKNLYSEHFVSYADKVTAESIAEFRTARITLPPKTLLFSVNLEWSVSDQIKQIQQFANSERDKLIKKKLIKSTRDETERFCDYLRAWDGDSAGASINEIAKILLPNDRFDKIDRTPYHKIKNWIKRAKEISEFDYINICSLSRK